MKKFRRTILICFSILIICFGGAVKAEHTEQSNSFSISPLNPDTNEPQSGYYNLKVKPSEKKKIKVRIFNSAKEEIEVNVEANDATTNDNGVISYSNEGEIDSTLKIPFSSIATLQQKRVKVPKEGSVDVEIGIEMPKEEYEGEILGGIRVSGVSKSKEATKDTPAVKANIAYSVAVLLTEKTDTMEPIMNLLDVKKENKNYRNYINAQLQNSAPRVIKDLEVHAKVYAKDSSDILYEAKKSGMQMAPNSNFKFGVNLENSVVKAGNYTMEISGKADGLPFSFKQDFNISKEEAKSLNENTVYVTGNSPDNTWVYIIAGALGTTLVLIVCYLAYKKTKSQKVGNSNESK